uniref:Uncharacterized protein n=1 Tax=Palpitomonas bilix TaxID=652834 RepID=A0A7S3LX47_9EUKA|mmetsp:Transcript_7918/g.20639  ORF Transcript_7918/g.20639 Transcript_7918/m.20639 type:complete len:692 (+) Transcript_7918:285-2360(+)
MWIEERQWRQRYPRLSLLIAVLACTAIGGVTMEVTPSTMSTAAATTVVVSDAAIGSLTEVDGQRIPQLHLKYDNEDGNTMISQAVNGTLINATYASFLLPAFGAPEFIGTQRETVATLSDCTGADVTLRSRRGVIETRGYATENCRFFIDPSICQQCPNCKLRSIMHTNSLWDVDFKIYPGLDTGQVALHFLTQSTDFYPGYSHFFWNSFQAEECGQAFTIDNPTYPDMDVGIRFEYEVLGDVFNVSNEWWWKNPTDHPVWIWTASSIPTQQPSLDLAVEIRDANVVDGGGIPVVLASSGSISVEHDPSGFPAKLKGASKRRILLQSDNEESGGTVVRNVKVATEQTDISYLIDSVSKLTDLAEVDKRVKVVVAPVSDNLTYPVPSGDSTLFSDVDATLPLTSATNAKIATSGVNVVMPVWLTCEQYEWSKARKPYYLGDFDGTTAVITDSFGRIQSFPPHSDPSDRSIPFDNSLGNFGTVISFVPDVCCESCRIVFRILAQIQSGGSSKVDVNQRYADPSDLASSSFTVPVTSVSSSSPDPLQVFGYPCHQSVPNYEVKVLALASENFGMVLDWKVVHNDEILKYGEVVRVEENIAPWWDSPTPVLWFENGAHVSLEEGTRRFRIPMKVYAKGPESAITAERSDLMYLEGDLFELRPECAPPAVTGDNVISSTFVSASDAANGGDMPCAG